MKTSFPVLLIAVSISLAAFFDGTDASYSCGGGFYNPEFHRISYVDPDLLSDSMYQSLYRSVLQQHQAKDGYFEVPHKEFRGTGWTRIRQRENMEEWRQYFEEPISDRSLRDFLYMSDGHLIDSLLTTLEQGAALTATDEIIPANSRWDKPDTLKFTEAIRLISKRKDIPFLRYYSYALECGPYAGSVNLWGNEKGKTDKESMMRLIEKGTQLHNNCNSNFLKLRYAYQIVRLARYANQFQRAMELYDLLVEPNPVRGPLRYRALGHKAGAARLAGETARANYWFAHVFDSCESEREIAVRDIRIKSKDDWNELYQLATTNHERATLWMLRGFKTGGLTFHYLQKIHELEPHSPRLALAALRELHRIESFLYAPMETRDGDATAQRIIFERTYDGDSTIPTEFAAVRDSQGEQSDSTGAIKASPKRPWDTLVWVAYTDPEESWNKRKEAVISGSQYVASFRRFVLQLAKEKTGPEPALWYMIAGYIDLMDNDFQIASECLNEAERIASGTSGDNLRQQIVLLDFMRRVKSRGKIDRELENSIYQTLEWFRQKQQQNRHSRFDRVMMAIGQQYLLQNDMPRALMAFSRADNYRTTNLLLDIYANDDDLKALQELLQKGPQSPYERMLFASIDFPEDGLLDLRGTKLLRQGKFDEALSLFDNISPAYWQIPEERRYREWDRTTFSPAFYGSYQEWFYSSTDTVWISGHNLISGSFNEQISSEYADEIGAIKYSKLTFTQEAVQLAEQAELQPELADSAYFKLGNLLFNNWRWSRADVTGDWNGSLSKYSKHAMYYPYNIDGIAQRINRADKTFRSQYATRELARTFYQKAMDLTDNSELAARCAYMLDLCLKRPLSNIVHHPTAKEQDRTGYELLISKYRDTEFSQWILSQCSIYRHFRAQENK